MDRPKCCQEPTDSMEAKSDMLYWGFWNNITENLGRIKARINTIEEIISCLGWRGSRFLPSPGAGLEDLLRYLPPLLFYLPITP